MPLVKISDLKTETPENVNAYLKWASELGGMYDRFIEADDENVSFDVGWGAAKERAPGLHASEVSGCQRPAVYSLMGTERREKIEAFWRKKFRTGHLFHGMLQNDFKRMCEKSHGMLSFESEVKISPKFQPMAEKWGINSSCDGIINFMDEPGGPPILRVGLELKTESPDEFAKLKKPRDYHLEQATVYQASLDLPLMWTFYYNKGNQNTMPSKAPWLFLFDHHLWAALEKRFEARHADAKAKNLPDRIEGIKCEFCAFSYLCDPEHLKKKAKRQAAKELRNKARKKTSNPHRRIQAPSRTL